MQIIGQEKLLEKLNSYTLSSIPKTLLFIGECGCGKHLFVNNLATRLDLDTVNIDSNISESDLVEYNLSNIPKLYVINLDNFDLKKQNQFLKFIEEPAQNVFVALLAESEIGVLPTILNRCIKLYFEPYTVEQLKCFDWMSSILDDRVFEVCKTPGQLINLDTEMFSKLYDLCDVIVHKVQFASYANTLSLSLKINYKEDYDKLDFKLFFKTLEYIAYKDFKETGAKRSYTIYMETNKAQKNMIGKPINKENFMTSFLTTIWEVTRA